MQVYPDPLRYWAEYVAGFDLEKADRLMEKYSPFEIFRAGLTKQKHYG